MKYTWLLFDADGTLFDYDLGESYALEKSFLEAGLPFSPAAADTYRAINHQIWLDFENGLISSERLRTRRFELLFEVVGAQTDVETFSARYLIHLSHSSHLVEGAEALVRLLRGQYHLGLITNGLKDVQRPRLARSAIDGLFDVVAISEEIGTAKPDPRFFEAAFAEMGNPPRETVLVIGDSLSSDILGGINYQLDTCWFNPQGKAPDPRIPAKYEIRRLADLREVLNT
jgi:YjjG family noncanonical pyrimidine nucleotidase